MLIGLAYLLGLATPDLVKRMSASRNPTPEIPTGPVLVAARDLNRGIRITLQDVKLENWPSEIIPSDAVTNPSTVIGKIVRSPVSQRQPIIGMNRASPFASTYEIPTGYRVIAIERKIRTEGLDRGINPGALVDVFQVGPDDKVEIIVPDVRVWSMGKSASSQRTIIGVVLADAEIDHVKLLESESIYADYAESLNNPSPSNAK